MRSLVALKRYVATRMVTMFGVLMVTLLLTIALVGSNMDTILKQGVTFQVRSEITDNPAIAESFSSVEEFEEYVQGQIEQRIITFGLDEPWHSPQRLGLSMFKILTLDFGHATFLTSDLGSSDVKDIILEKLPRTILLFTTATIIISIIGIFLGALSGSRVGSVVDRITSSFAIISSSFPVWWIGMLMIFLFAFVYQIFPARATPAIPPSDPAYIGALLYHMALPLITIVMIGFGAWAYLVRNFMVGIMQEDFILAKKTIGIRQRKIIYKHALKNAAPPIITILALSLSGSLGGAIITEAVFDWPGMGRLYFEAITVMDLPVIIGATYVLTVFFLASIFIADLLYGYFDPRVRTGN
ncbi:MAG: ABC transporter permease [Thaumarchaeota archaeon]|nr:ABC transporter permease [Nitrososphaerota archaeon]